MVAGLLKDTPAAERLDKSPAAERLDKSPDLRGVFCCAEALAEGPPKIMT